MTSRPPMGEYLNPYRGQPESDPMAQPVAPYLFQTGRHQSKETDAENILLKIILCLCWIYLGYVICKSFICCEIPHELHNCTWQIYIKGYSKLFVLKFPSKFVDPYIIGIEFVLDKVDKRIHRLKMVLPAVWMFWESHMYIILWSVFPV